MKLPESLDPRERAFKLAKYTAVFTVIFLCGIGALFIFFMGLLYVRASENTTYAPGYTTYRFYTLTPGDTQDLARASLGEPLSRGAVASSDSVEGMKAHGAVEIWYYSSPIQSTHYFQKQLVFDSVTHRLLLKKNELYFD